MALRFNPTSGYLPDGVHRVTWGEVVQLCGSNNHRQALLEKLRAALVNLRDAGCAEVLLNGSFVTAKELPNDYDGAWEPAGVDPDLLDDVLLDFSDGRAAMKAKYGGELFVSSMNAAPGVLFRDFFQSDRNGNRKGILSIDLESIT